MLIVVMSTALAGCGGEADTASEALTVDSNGKLSKPTTVTFAAPCSTTGCIVPFALDALGEFKKRNITLKTEVIPSTDAIPLAATGKLDAYLGGMSVGLLNAIAAGSDIRVVAPTYQFPSETTAGIYVSTKLLGDQTFSAATLKGQKIASSQGNAGSSMPAIIKLIESVGLTPNDVEIVQMAETDQVAALKNGSIFMGILNEPISKKVSEQKTAVRVGSQLLPGYPASVVVYGKNLLGENDAIGKAVAAALRATYVNKLQGEFLKDATIAQAVADGLKQPVDSIQSSRSDVYPTELSFPDNFVEIYTSAWKQYPDLLQGRAGDLTTDDVVAPKFAEFANQIKP